MTRSKLENAVARATGESLSTIRNRGFSLANPLVVKHDPEPPPVAGQIVDWDEVQAHRVAIFPGRRQTALAA